MTTTLTDDTIDRTVAAMNTSAQNRDGLALQAKAGHPAARFAVHAEAQRLGIIDHVQREPQR